MSIWSTIGKFGATVLGEALGNSLGNALSPSQAQMNRFVPRQTTLPAVPGAGFRTGGSMSNFVPRQGPPQSSGMLPPRGFHYAKDGSGRVVRNRRMNPTNPRALRRAIRRIKSFRRIAHQIERQLPTRTVHRRK